MLKVYYEGSVVLSTFYFSSLNCTSPVKKSVELVFNSGKYLRSSDEKEILNKNKYGVHLSLFRVP